jgi:hypothetical protein
VGAVVTLADARERRGGAARAADPDPDPDLGPGLGRRAAASLAARDWLETQARVVEYWRDLLVASGETGDLVAALDAHAAFLNGVVAQG